MNETETDGRGGILSQRRSTRGFLTEPVDLCVLQDILRLARTAPSGANLQPGFFHVLTGKPLTELSRHLIAADRDNRPKVEEYSYFPQPMPPELKMRQIEAGFALYGALGIGRRDVAGRRAQFLRNYRFFDAPIGIIVTIRRDMGKGCFMDLGMTLQNLFLAAEQYGLGTCGIGALANYGDLIHAHLKLPEHELVVCGVALGRPDPANPVNQTKTSRLPLDAFTKFCGF